MAMGKRAAAFASVLFLVGASVRAVGAADPVLADGSRFTLGHVWAQVDETVVVKFGVETDETLSMVSWSVEYDPALFEFVAPVLSPELRQLLERSSEADSSYSWHSDPEAGWLQVDLVVDFQGRPDRSLPPGIARRVADLTFRVLPDAAPGEHPVRFSHPGEAPYEGYFHGEKGPVYNVVRRAGPPIELGNGRFSGADEPQLSDGVISVSPIIGDVGIFVRGDANLDFAVDITDPVAILGGLFFNGGRFPCKAAADANRDAEVDISDPITVLNFLFLGSGDWIPTSERVGEVDDGLPCDELYEQSDGEGSS